MSGYDPQQWMDYDFGLYDPEEDEKVNSDAERAPKSAPKCVCDIRVIMMKGCDCGAFKEEQRLKKEREKKHG